MLATIDVGSNTLRMLIGTGTNSSIRPHRYYRQITRLGGGCSDEKGLTPESMERAHSALLEFKHILDTQQVSQLRMVGTAALRRAINRQQFVSEVKNRTGLILEIIDGAEEARLTAAGVLSVVDPIPKLSLIIDIGGGSTELVCCQAERILLQKSYPLGVVRLCEEFPGHPERQQQISALLGQFLSELTSKLQATDLRNCQLIGTAGTVTTLAAMQLKLTDYDWRKINNQTLSLAWLKETRENLQPLSVAERERLPGMEAGRGDLILPGLELLLILLQGFGKHEIKVADAGLLEGVMLDLCKS